MCLKNTVQKLGGSGAGRAVLSSGRLIPVLVVTYLSTIVLARLLSSVDESLTTFSDGYLGSNNDEGRSEV